MMNISFNRKGERHCWWKIYSWGEDSHGARMHLQSDQFKYTRGSLCTTSSCLGVHAFYFRDWLAINVGCLHSRILLLWTTQFSFWSSFSERNSVGEPYMDDLFFWKDKNPNVHHWGGERGSLGYTSAHITMWVRLTWRPSFDENLDDNDCPTSYTTFPMRTLRRCTI